MAVETSAKRASKNGSAPAAETPAATGAPQIQITGLAQETMLVPIKGTSPLIVHRFSEKAKRQMLDNMQGRRTPKAPKDPEADYEGAFYRCADNSYGFPSNAFKLATVDASRFYGKEVSKVGLRQFLFVFGEDQPDMARLEGEPVMREDVVRVGQGTDLRYRPEFAEWSTTLRVTFFNSVLTRGSVLSLIDAGGLGVGVGEWRPARDGTNGMYRVDVDRELVVLS